MPYKTRKVRNRNCYKVYKPSNGKVFAKCTSKKKAIKQMNLLRAIQFNKNFVPNGRRKNKTQKRRTK